MTHARHGRHRAPKPAARGRVAVAVALILAAAVASGLLWVIDDQSSPTASVPRPTTPADRSAKATNNAQIERTLTVDVSGSRVTSTATTIVSGGSVVVRPSHAAVSPALIHELTLILNPDGTRSEFDETLTLPAGGRLTIEGRYRLRRCPALLPAEWPTPDAIAPGNWTQTMARIDAPLRTSRAICPNAPLRAGRAPGLVGSLTESAKLVVKLNWQERPRLTIDAIGAAGTVAARGIESCRQRCVAVLKPDSRERLVIRPVEACPIGERSNLLTLLVRERNRPERVVRLNVPGLGRRVCNSKA